MISVVMAQPKSHDSSLFWKGNWYGWIRQWTTHEMIRTISPKPDATRTIDRILPPRLDTETLKRSDSRAAVSHLGVTHSGV